MKRKFKYFFVFILFFLALFLWRESLGAPPNGLKFFVLDIGQGDAIFIETPEGGQILVDGGPDKSVLSELGKVMPFYDRSIDVVIATHPDSDHIGGLPMVLDKFYVSLILEPGVTSDNYAQKAIDDLTRKKGINRILASRGMKMVFDEETYLLVLFPDRNVEGLDSNDASIVAKLVYKDTSFLLTGDSPRKIERYLMNLSPESLQADVLKVGHHGSKTSTSEEFVNAVNPVYTVISAGANNRYGHPHQEVSDILNKFGVKILRTDELGTIKMESDGENVSLAGLK